MTKKVSFIIPMFNVEKYLETCIGSVVNQGLYSDEFEILMINDESPDNSVNVANSIATKHSCVKVISQKNQGLGGARNTGIINAKGEYLLFLDADDIYIENTIKEILSIGILNNLDILEFGAQGIDEQGNITYQVSNNSSTKITSGIEYYNKIKYMNSACNKLYKRSFLLDNQLLFVEKIFGEDFEFNTRALYMAKRVMAIDNIVAQFLQTENSITRTKDIEKKRKYIDDLIDILRRIQKFRLEFESLKKNGHNLFFNKRMTLTTIDIFFQMFKYNFPFSEILKTKHLLESENIFYSRNTVNDLKKNLFRTIFLNFNFFFFYIASNFKILTSKSK
jgi:glycosyltransferase involved in cell wall biosynthesis